MCTSLLSTTAVFTGLYITGLQLNITALMGMVMIVGIATEMAIFYVSEFQELLTHMQTREALMRASANRLRPIAMTTLAAIVTLMPLALDLAREPGCNSRWPWPSSPGSWYSSLSCCWPCHCCSINGAV